MNSSELFVQSGNEYYKNCNDREKFAYSFQSRAWNDATSSSFVYSSCFQQGTNMNVHQLSARSQRNIILASIRIFQSAIFASELFLHNSSSICNSPRLSRSFYLQTIYTNITRSLRSVHTETIPTPPPKKRRRIYAVFTTRVKFRLSGRKKKGLFTRLKRPWYLLLKKYILLECIKTTIYECEERQRRKKSKKKKTPKNNV